MAEKPNASFAFMAGGENKNESMNFIVDSGASDHMVNNETFLQKIEYLSTPVKISVAKNGEYIEANKKGEMAIISCGNEILLKDVLYCRDIPHNLLSVGKMQAAGMIIIFNDNGVLIKKGSQIVMQGKLLNNMPIINAFKINVQSALSINVVENNKYNLWHQRLGHIGVQKFLEIKNKKLFEDIKQIESVVPCKSLCEACINGKQAQLKYNKKKNKSHIKRPLFVVHTDVCGPITPVSINEENYFLIFVDQYTHYCVTYLIARKSDVFDMFKDFVQKSEAHFKEKLVNLYCDNGREYLSLAMKEYCVLKGISYHLTVPYTPQLNGVAERMIRTITEKARAMLHGAGLEKKFWGEAVLTATFLINRTPSNAIIGHVKTPFELWHGKKPVLKYLKIFGSTVYRLNKLRNSKFQDKSLKGILVGYDANGYKVWCVEQEKFVMARDVIVDEENFVKSRAVDESRISRLLNESNHSEYLHMSEENFEEPCTEKGNSCKAKAGLNNNSDMTRISRLLNESNQSEYLHMSEENFQKPCTEKSNSCKAKAGLNNNSDMTEICSVKKKPRLEEEQNDVQCTDENSSENCDISEQRQIDKGLKRSERIKHQKHISYKEDDYDSYLMSAQIAINEIPNSFQEIQDRNDRVYWENAIKEELESHKYNGTWSLVEMPKNKNIIDNKWVFSIKNDEYGNPVRYKARLVARGFTQEHMIDYHETFAPVARISSFRYMMAFANQNNLLVHHMDVKTAFLNGDLEEDIFMKLPQGLNCKSNLVCKLHKAIYGLKQAARCWFQKFEQIIKEKGFQNSAVDRCIYVINKRSIYENIYLILYVDDIVIMTASSQSMSEIKRYLQTKFQMSDLGEIKFFVGIRIEKENNVVKLSQSAYIKRILVKFGMENCNPVRSPLPSKLDYEALNSDENFDAPCRNLIGCLMYVMLCTRPDLSASVSILSRYSHKNNKELWQCLKRILRYLKGSIDLKLEYKVNNYKELLIAYVDSDWGGSDCRDRKSTTGFLFKMFDNCTICWSTRRQTSVAASSTEAEYMALFEAVREALWLKSLTISINVETNNPIKIFEDNIGCISIANNPIFHKRTKHIDIKYHFTREQIEHNLICIQYISTEEQLADAMTKILPAARFLYLRAQMGLK